MQRAIVNLLCVHILLLALEAEGGTFIVPGTPGTFAVNVASMKELRFRNTIKQQYDYSCGSATLATLLTYHYEDPVTEQEVFQTMFESGNQEKIRKEGFSMLDMKKFLDARQYKADGFKVSLDKLRELGVPAIVLINTRGYKHFVVVKGIAEKRVLLGDPALGVRTIPRAEFEKMWNGLIFIVRNKKNIAQSHFNNEKEWGARGKAPLGLALSNSELANITINLPIRGSF